MYKLNKKIGWGEVAWMIVVVGLGLILLLSGLNGLMNPEIALDAMREQGYGYGMAYITAGILILLGSTMIGGTIYYYTQLPSRNDDLVLGPDDLD